MTVFDKQIEVGTEFVWLDIGGARVEVKSIRIDEDAKTQIRIDDDLDDGKRTIALSDLVEKVEADELVVVQG